MPTRSPEEIRQSIEANRAEQEQHERHDQEPEPGPIAGAEQLPYAPRGGVQQVDQPGQREDPRDRPGHDAADQLLDLRGHLRLRERDLLAHQELHLLGDLLDRLTEL